MKVAVRDVDGMPKALLAEQTALDAEYEQLIAGQLDSERLTAYAERLRAHAQRVIEFAERVRLGLSARGN